MAVRLTSSDTSNYAYLLRNITAAPITGATDAYTICGWFKPVVWVQYNPMMALTSSTGSRTTSIELYGSGDGSSPDDVVYAVGGSGTTHTFDIATGTWIFRAFTMDAGNSAGAHYAGVAATGDLTQGTGISGSAGAMNYVVVGDLAQPGLVQAFNGEVEHIRIWKAQLTEAELRAERDSTTPVKASPYLAWSLVNAADTADISGNGRTWTGTTVGTGTVTNGASNSPPGAYSASSSAPVGIIRPRQQFAFSSAIARHS
jgi:hypothetical protein